MSDRDKPTTDESSEAGDEQDVLQVRVVMATGAPPPRRYKRIRQKDSWLRDRYDPTKEEKEKWADAGMPPDVEIIAGFLMSNNLVFGVPSKAEIFGFAQRTKEADETYNPDAIHSMGGWMHLRIVKPSPIPAVYYTLASPPIGVHFGDIVEHNYNVRLQAISTRMVLTQIRVIHGSETDDDPRIVFEGTEYPGAAIQRNIRVVRVTVHTAEYATWEVVSETKFPGTRF